MKIIQLCAIDQTMKIFLKPLNDELMKQGFEVIGVCSNGPYTEELKGDGLRIINVRINRKIGFFSNISSVYKLYKLFRREKPDVVHAHTPIAAILGRIAASLAKVPIIIYTAHGFYFHDKMSRFKYRLFLGIEKFTAKHFTDFIFTQSNEDRLTAVRNGFLEESKIVCIGNGIDVFGKFNPMKIDYTKIIGIYDEFGLSERDIIITFIGRLVEEKGIAELLDAFSNIDNNNIKLLVVGDIDQDCRDQKTKGLLIDKYKVNRNIIFTGFRRDINLILCATDIFCLPSYREGMPRTIIEAMAMECAVIATNIRGCREEVVDGVTGFLVRPQSALDIQIRLAQLIEDKMLLQSMKVEGRKRAEKHFDEKKVVDMQIDIINRLYQEFKKI